MTNETCPKCGAERFNTYNSTNCYETTQYACGSECELYEITGEIKLLSSPECYERQLAAKDAEIERLRQALKNIADAGGTIDDESGLSHNGSWCAEQARTAL